jgi:hypothetical protein
VLVTVQESGAAEAPSRLPQATGIVGAFELSITIGAQE